MPDSGSSWFQQGPGNANSSLGQTSDQPLTWTAPDASTVGAASAELVAADAGAVGRTVILFVPGSAATGIHINFGAAATTSKFLIPAGGTLTLNTTQQIRAIRGGASDVTVYVLTGKV